MKLRFFRTMIFAFALVLLRPMPAQAFAQGVCPLMTYTLTFTPNLKVAPATVTVDIHGEGSCTLDDGMGMPPILAHDISIDATTTSVSAFTGTCADLVTLGDSASVAFDPAGPSGPSDPIVVYAGSAEAGTLLISDNEFAGAGELIAVDDPGPTGLVACASSGIKSFDYLGSFVVGDVS